MLLQLCILISSINEVDLILLQKLEKNNLLRKVFLHKCRIVNRDKDLLIGGK